MFFFFLGPFVKGEKKTNKQSPPPKKSRDNPVKIVFTCFFLFMCFFSLPTKILCAFSAPYSPFLKGASTWKLRARGEAAILWTDCLVDQLGFSE